MKKIIMLIAILAFIPITGYSERATVTISPLYANAKFRVGGVNITFKTYDMQRYRNGNEWNWTVNYCEIYANNQLLAKIHSEEMNTGQEFSKSIGGKNVRVIIKEMPKVTKTMHCRGPVQPCWTKSHPVTRATHITLEIIAGQQ